MKENFYTHKFVGTEEAYCSKCACGPFSTASLYPCGVEPPREDVEI